MVKALRGASGTAGVAGSAGYTIITTTAGLPGSPADGSGVIVRLGSGSGTKDLLMFYNSALSKWLSVEEHVLFYCNDIDNVTVAPPYTSMQYVPNGGQTYWSVVPLTKVGLGYSAGLTLQYREEFFAQRSTDGKFITALTSFYQYNDGDSNIVFTVPISGMIGQTSGVNAGAPVASDSFTWKENGWADLVFTTTPTKSSLYGVICAAMDAGATSNGHFVDYSCMLRWVA